MGRVKGVVSLLFPHVRLLVTQRVLCREEKNTELQINVLRKQASVWVYNSLTSTAIYKLQLY